MPLALLSSLVSIPDFEAAAEKEIAPAVWARIQGGAADEITLRWNCDDARTGIRETAGSQSAAPNGYRPCRRGWR